VTTDKRSGNVSLFDALARESVDQWVSVLDECERLGFYCCPLDTLGQHWFLYPMGELMGADH